MPFDQDRYRQLSSEGLPHAIAVRLATTTAVSAPSALTAPASMGATYTKSEVDALRADVAALRTTVAALISALKESGDIK